MESFLAPRARIWEENSKLPMEPPVNRGEGRKKEKGRSCHILPGSHARLVGPPPS
jgi:hypothetical protein